MKSVLVVHVSLVQMFLKWLLSSTVGILDMGVIVGRFLIIVVDRIIAIPMTLEAVRL